MKSVREQERILFSLGLGITVLPVVFVASEAFEVPGINSLGEIVAGCLFGAAYLAFCQFWMSPRDRRGFRAKLPAMATLNAPLLALAALAILGNNLSPVPGLPWLVSGVLGTIGGDLAAMRLSAWLTPQTPATSKLDPWLSPLRCLQLAIGLLAGVAPIFVFGVLPPLLADHTPGFYAGRVAAFLCGTVVINLIAAYLARVALRSGPGDRFSRGRLGPPVFMALLLGLIYVFASGIRSQNPALGTASMLLVLCAVADLFALALLITTSFSAERVAQQG